MSSPLCLLSPSRSCAPLPLTTNTPSPSPPLRSPSSLPRSLPLSACPFPFCHARPTRPNRRQQQQQQQQEEEQSSSSGPARPLALALQIQPLVPLTLLQPLAIQTSSARFQRRCCYPGTPFSWGNKVASRSRKSAGRQTSVSAPLRLRGPGPPPLQPAPLTPRKPSRPPSQASRLFPSGSGAGSGAVRGAGRGRGRESERRIPFLSLSKPRRLPSDRLVHLRQLRAFLFSAVMRRRHGRDPQAERQRHLRPSHLGPRGHLPPHCNLCRLPRYFPGPIPSTRVIGFRSRLRKEATPWTLILCLPRTLATCLKDQRRWACRDFTAPTLLIRQPCLRPPTWTQLLAWCKPAWAHWCLSRQVSQPTLKVFHLPLPRSPHLNFSPPASDSLFCLIDW